MQKRVLGPAIIVVLALAVLLYPATQTQETPQLSATCGELQYETLQFTYSNEVQNAFPLSPGWQPGDSTEECNNYPVGGNVYNEIYGTEGFYGLLQQTESETISQCNNLESIVKNSISCPPGCAPKFFFLESGACFSSNNYNCDVSFTVTNEPVTIPEQNINNQYVCLYSVDCEFSQPLNVEQGYKYGCEPASGLFAWAYGKIYPVPIAVP